MYWLKPSSLIRSSLLVIGIMLVPIQASWSQKIQTSDLIQRLNWIRFELVQGRIVTRDTRQGQSRSATVTNEKKKIREEVTLKIVGGTPLFQYRYQDADQIVQIELINNHRLVIKRNPTATADWPSVEVQQPERGPLRMVVTQGPSSKVYTAKHLWQLMLSHPDPCRKHLYPLLELLRSDWQLEQWSEQVETSLIRMASYHTHPEYDHLQRLIEQLADPAFRIRQSADRQLRAMGQPVISYLNQLNTKNMTTEQRLRIRRILSVLNHAYRGHTGSGDCVATKQSTDLVYLDESPRERYTQDRSPTTVPTGTERTALHPDGQSPTTPVTVRADRGNHFPALRQRGKPPLSPTTSHSDQDWLARHPYEQLS